MINLQKEKDKDLNSNIDFEVLSAFVGRIMDV
jgi:hypothetical protein